jgi:hypothetical protein
VEADVSHQPISQSRLDQVLGSAAERDEKVVIVRVDGGAAAGKVRPYRNGISFKAKLPALGVVAGRRQGRVAYELTQKSALLGGGNLAVTPGTFRNILVAVYIGS